MPGGAVSRGWLDSLTLVGVGFKPTLPRPCDAGLGPHHDGTLFMCEADGGPETRHYIRLTEA